MDVNVEKIICSKCIKMVRPPIRQCDEMHIVCNQCNRHLGTSEENVKNSQYCRKGVFHNPIIDILFKKSKDTCQYSCGFNDNLVVLGMHEQHCYKNNKLIKCAINNCKWHKELSQLLPHTISAHPSHVKHLSDPKMDLCIGSYNPVVLVTEYESDAVDNPMYWLRYHEDDNSHKYVLMLYIGRGNVSRREEPKVLDYVISCIEYQNVIVRTQSLISCGSPEDDIEKESFLINKGTNINALEADTLQVRVVKPPGEDFPKSVLKELECIVCLKFMINEIRLCVNGHSLCSNCVGQMANCPTCRGTIGTGRNYQLQNIAQIFNTIQQRSRKRVRCKYEYHGCDFIDILHNVTDHERDECTYRHLAELIGTPEPSVLNSGPVPI